MKARNRFNDANPGSATIGRYAFGFTWGAWAAITLAAFLLLIGGVFGKSSHKRRSTPINNGNGAIPETTTASGGGGMGFFKRQRHRGGDTTAFADGESQHRVKDEYA